jgi:aspartate-semialdehyde dehydrogenase
MAAAVAASAPLRVFVAGHRGMVGSALQRRLEQEPDIELVTWASTRSIWRRPKSGAFAPTTSSLRISSATTCRSRRT